MRDLELGLIGNSSIGALVDNRAELVWACFPRFDADAQFCSLLRERGGADDFGYFAVDLEDFAHAEQAYAPNSPVLLTRLHDKHGGIVEVVDFAPRFRQFGRLFCPAQLVRIVRPVAGSPRVRMLLRPASEYGRERPRTTAGTNHVRFVGTDYTLRVTTDCSITAVLEESTFSLRNTVAFLIGPDETLQGGVAETARRFHELTLDYWHDWVRDLSIPFEWQDDIIRAAITLKLAAYDDTGAVIAAFTTSIPEAPGSGRNWDYRFCWLRDAYFVVNALNRLNATRTMERYIGYIINVASQARGALQPVYRISGSPELPEKELASLPGYRGMGPVRVGNQAAAQVQNDVYGSAVLAATHAFFDRRLMSVADAGLFRQLEVLGDRALAAHDQPDAGLWELRGSARVHTFSSLMCWVACDRLAKIAARLGIGERARYWRSAADGVHAVISERAWSGKRQAFTSSFGGEELDASLLLLHELGFLRADDPRFASTVDAIGKDLRRGDFIFRYAEADDFGAPTHAFLVCTFWYIDALASLGRRDEARALFEATLARRTRLGLFAEHAHPETGELWGNFPQTYSMVGMINSATRLSIPWDEAF
ncbi:glycoside hydrolase family 15 protein [Usitatibacter palustris]|uniref:Trehalase n=1 Tax=Usitatibacter palustris TaxID=2732487 RepID=A0A6M4H3Q0_9PROT|nr:glycoside hydrolase family 15 protein [Usitatibacter palustris]QJR14070.1 Trehalase [Usitatibacter palustris]